MKRYIVYFTLIALFPLSIHADYIFEEAYMYAVVNKSWDAISLDGGDFNNDGLPDFVASYSYRNGEDMYLYTFLGNGDCTFDALTTDIFTYPLGSITVNDFNNDGCDDLLIGEGCGDYFGAPPIVRDIVHLFEGNGDGSFTEIDTLHVKNIWVTSGDLNDDGNADLVTSFNGGTGDTVIVALGNGDFTFQGTESYEIPSRILHTVQILGDMDLDGNVDIGVIGMFDEVSFLYGNGDGTFQPAVVVAEHCGSFCFNFIGVGDFNEDGMPDMAATGNSAMPTYDEVFVWKGNDSFIYEPVDTVGLQGQWIEIEDFNMDGHLDIVESSASRGYVVPGNGDGTFSYNYLFMTVYNAEVVLSADFDLDGDYDLIFCEEGYPECVRCYRNTTITQGCEGESPGSMTNPVLDVSPNPFSSFVSIEVSGYSTEIGNLQIFDLSGRLVAELEPVSSEGGAVFHWNGVSSSGAELPSGIYTVRLIEGNVAATAELLKLE